MAAFAALLGNSVEVIAPIPYTASWWPAAKSRKLASIPEREVIGGISVHHPRYALLPKVSMPIHAWLMASGCVDLAHRLHAAEPFDLLDAHFIYPDGSAGVRIAKALGVPAVVSARGSDLNLFPRFRTIRPQIRSTLRAANGRIAVSRALQSAMLEVDQGVRDIRVIGNGVDPSRFFPVDPQEARHALGIPSKSLVALCVAALLPLKRQDAVIRAVHRLLPQFPDLQLYLVGQGAWGRELEELATKLGVQASVHLVGPCPNESLRFWYSAADVSVLASSREGWPNVLLESLACGTPVVATRVGGNSEVISSSALGVLVDQSDDSLADGLRRALIQDWHRAAMVAYARTRDWSLVAREVEEYFREILARNVSQKS